MTSVSAREIANVAVRLPTAAFLVWLLYRRIIARRQLPSGIRLPAKVVGLLILVLTIGLLGGCVAAQSHSRTVARSHPTAYIAEVASEVSS